MTKPPKTWVDCEKVLRSDELPEMLQIALVRIAFNESNLSTAVKAIELLATMPRVRRTDELSDFRTDELMEAERRAKTFLNSIAESMIDEPVTSE